MEMPETLSPVAVASIIFACTFAAALFGMVLHLKLPDHHLNDESREVERVGSSIPWPFLMVLVFWLLVLFLGFGFFASVNATVLVALLIGAVSLSSGIFLILELDQPYAGLIRVSDAPLRHALAELDQ
jgi:hypothetical protein